LNKKKVGHRGNRYQWGEKGEVFVNLPFSGKGNWVGKREKRQGGKKDVVQETQETALWKKKGTCRTGNAKRKQKQPGQRGGGPNGKKKSQEYRGGSRRGKPGRKLEGFLKNLMKGGGGEGSCGRGKTSCQERKVERATEEHLNKEKEGGP